MYVYVIHMSLAVVRCFISPCGAQFWRCIDTILEPSKINVRNGIVCPFQNTQICLGGSQFLHPVGGSSRWLLVARPLWARVHLALWHPESVPLKLLEEWRCSTGSSALHLGIGWRNLQRNIQNTNSKHIHRNIEIPNIAWISATSTHDIPWCFHSQSNAINHYHYSHSINNPSGFDRIIDIIIIMISWSYPPPSWSITTLNLSRSFI
jgi:hypothetical protein